MELVNAIAKARFASARGQRVVLHKDDSVQIDLLCLELEQELSAARGQWTYYVVKGTAGIGADQTEGSLTAGQIAISGLNEKHTVRNVGQQRLVCIAMGKR